MPNDIGFKGTKLQRVGVTPRDYAEVGFSVHFSQSDTPGSGLIWPEQKGGGRAEGPLGDC